MSVAEDLGPLFCNRVAIATHRGKAFLEVGESDGPLRAVLVLDDDEAATLARGLVRASHVLRTSRGDRVAARSPLKPANAVVAARGHPPG